jgi:hypothetical protein
MSVASCTRISRGSPRSIAAVVPGTTTLLPNGRAARRRRGVAVLRLRDIDPDGALFLFQAPELSGPWWAHPGNPVRKGRAGSRPAGPLFEAEGRLNRPGQDCSRTYGGGVILHDVTRLDGTDYEEVAVRRLDPVQGPHTSGLHTICPSGELTLIDGKCWRWNAGGALRKLRRRFFPDRPAHCRVVSA